MILTFRPIKVWPDGWRGDPDRMRTASPFTASHSETLQLLDRELRHLGATSVSLQVDASDREVRLDGQLRADAKVGHPGVILTVETKNLGTQVYACDRFLGGDWGRRRLAAWQANLRAIALGLEALRKVERYGIAERGQQYAGYRELGTGGIELGRAPMTVEQAAAFICEYQEARGEPGAVDFAPGHLIQNSDHAAVAFRGAAKRLHPDAGGDPELFKRLTEARDVLEAFHG
jgi:hypothetical protein